MIVPRRLPTVPAETHVQSPLELESPSPGSPASLLAGVGVAVISRRAAERLRAGHVWVYRSDVEDLTSENPGLIAVVDDRGLLLGTALFNPHSQITLRLLTSDRLPTRDALLKFLEERLRRAIALRRTLMSEDTDACRLVFSEADQLPGLIVDQYGDLILFEIVSKALDADDIRDRIVAALKAELDPSTIVERSDARIRELEQLSEREQPLLFSKDAIPQLATIFHMNGLAFHYDARAGQKTGAFLDQRLNYAAAARYAHGEALDVCTYQGGFALHLARVCTRVTGVDISRPALEVAEENLAVNQHRVISPVEWIEANAFDLLRDWSNAGHSYDTIVLDPPAFAKTKRAVAGAVRGYKELNLRAFKMIRPGGILVTCSCSHHVSQDQFQEIVAGAASDAHRRVKLIERRGAAPDHPVVLNIPETEYLKCLILAVE
jgi:23S rRNA (cytosine1962-C5)-methyltransferase